MICQPKVQILLLSFLRGLLFNLGACWDKGLDSDLDQGLTKIADLELSIERILDPNEKWEDRERTVVE